MNVEIEENLDPNVVIKNNTVKVGGEKNAAKKTPLVSKPVEV